MVFVGLTLVTSAPWRQGLRLAMQITFAPLVTDSQGYPAYRASGGKTSLLYSSTCLGSCERDGSHDMLSVRHRNLSRPTPRAYRFLPGLPHKIWIDSGIPRVVDMQILHHVACRHGAEGNARLAAVRVSQGPEQTASQFGQDFVFEHLDIYMQSWRVLSRASEVGGM